MKIITEKTEKVVAENLASTKKPELQAEIVVLTAQGRAQKIMKKV